MKITYVEDVPDLLDPVHDNIFMSGPGDQPNSSAESDHSGQIGETYKMLNYRNKCTKNRD